jgi:peptidase E
VQLVKWSPPREMTKSKVNTDASISEDGQFFIGLVIFDFRVIYHFRYAKKCSNACFQVDAKDPKQLAICEVETYAIRETIRHMVERNCLPTDIETNNSMCGNKYRRA